MRTSPSVPGIQGKEIYLCHKFFQLYCIKILFVLSHHVPTRELEDHEKNCPSMQMMSQILYTTENQRAPVGAKVTSRKKTFLLAGWSHVILSENSARWSTDQPWRTLTLTGKRRQRLNNLTTHVRMLNYFYFCTLYSYISNMRAIDNLGEATAGRDVLRKIEGATPSQRQLWRQGRNYELCDLI